MFGHYCFWIIKAHSIDTEQDGIPHPSLRNVKVEHKEKVQTYSGFFYTNNYKKLIKKLLYCWSCLLVTKEHGPFTTQSCFNSSQYTSQK